MGVSLPSQKKQKTSSQTSMRREEKRRQKLMPWVAVLAAASWFPASVANAVRVPSETARAGAGGKTRGSEEEIPLVRRGNGKEDDAKS
jgi:hypothetical protein